MKAHVSETKKEEVKLLEGLMSKYKVVGIIDLTGMPSPQLQIMRKKLKDALIRITKKRLLKIALDDLKKNKKGIEQLEDVMKEEVMPCLILTNEDSFRLAKVLRKAKTNIAAKPGQIAPKDIVIKAGPTPFTPGPIIGEFSALGIKAAVEGGKIAIKQDKVLVKEGEEINIKAADILGKLGIEPMQIGLNLIATYDNGTIFKKDVLDVDDKWYLDTIKLIANDGFKLAIQIGYMTKETIEFLIKKAENEAKALEQPSLEKNVDEEKKIEVKEEPKQEIEIEEKKEEVPKKEEIKIEEKPKVKIEDKDKLETLKKEPLEKKPSAQELIEEAEEEIEEEKKKEEVKKKEKEKKERVPTAAELAAKKKEEKKKEPEKVPSAAELAKKKKKNESKKSK